MESHLRLLSAFHCLLFGACCSSKRRGGGIGCFGSLCCSNPFFFFLFIYFKVKPYVVSHIKRIIPSVILRVKITAH